MILFNEKRTDHEARSTQRNRPLNRIMAKFPSELVQRRALFWRFRSSRVVVGRAADIR